MRHRLKNSWRGLFFCLVASVSWANYSHEIERQDFDLAVSTPSYARPPSDRHRLFLDVYNVTDFYDFETLGVPQFPDRTVIADTLRPTFTILWDEQFRIQLGVIAERLYGDRTGFGSVDPWLQLLWMPTSNLHLIVGNLDVPHYYLPAIFYPTNYIEQRTHESGLQLQFTRPNWYDDLFFNYHINETQHHNEKFDFGMVHRNTWKFLSFNYQSHWIHQGGAQYPHPLNTTNDVAQMIGGDIHFRLMRSVVLGAKYSYLHSHYRIEAPTENRTVNGDGNLYEAYLRISRFKFIYGNWQGDRYSHEGGDPMFTLPVVNMATLRWDIIQSRDFNLLFSYTGYYIGNNQEEVDHYVKSAFHIQAAWQFSIPIIEWTSPAVSPEGPPVPARWDDGI